jgi:Zn-dependent protease
MESTGRMGAIKRMQWLRTLRLGRFLGVDLYLRWSFWILLAWIAVNQLIDGGPLAALQSLTFFTLVFLSVYLHELGHAQAASWFGIRTLDITLLPFGGMARLESMPREPRAEAVIALAGPAVNLAIAAIVASLLWLTGALQTLFDQSPLRTGWLHQLAAVNGLLALFNLIPAFPLDGGRALRAYWTPRWGHLEATSRAVGIGKWIAYGMIAIGILRGAWSMVLLAVLVLLAGFAELFQARRRAILEAEGNWPPPNWDLEGHFQHPRSPGSEHGTTIDADDVRRLD